jgi:hypothetical protein
MQTDNDLFIVSKRFFRYSRAKDRFNTVETANRAHISPECNVRPRHRARVTVRDVQERKISVVTTARRNRRTCTYVSCRVRL